MSVYSVKYGFVAFDFDVAVGMFCYVVVGSCSLIIKQLVKT